LTGSKVILGLFLHFFVVLAWKSGLKVPVLPLGPSILLSNLEGCDSPPLQIVMAIRRTFLKFEARQTAITICSGLSCLTQQVQILKK
jgi:hypothetical protein